VLCKALKYKIFDTGSAHVPYWILPHHKASCFRVIKKLAHRALALFFSGQFFKRVIKASLEQDVCILYVDRKNIGDAIMDLSAISFLRDAMPQEYSIDLVVSRELYSLFECDPRFRHVVSSDNHDEIANLRPSLVMTLLMDYQAISYKKRFFNKLDFMVLHGWFGAPDRNLMRHTALNLAKAFSLGAPEVFVSKVKHFFHPCVNRGELEFPLDTCNKRVGIVLGGIDPRRTYQHWMVVVGFLLKHDIQVVLMGSSNARKEEDKILNRFESYSAKKTLISYIDKANFAQFLSLCRECNLIMSADGGAMHMALSVNKPMICLFSEEYPESRLPYEFLGEAFHAKGDISSIKADEVSKTAFELLGNQAY